MSNESIVKNVVLNYYEASKRLDDGSNMNNWFNFGVWAAKSVGRFIIRYHSEPLRRGMLKMFDEVMSDEEGYGLNPYSTLEMEQALVNPEITEALGDHWELATKEWINVRLPHKTLWVSERVPGTVGPLGSPATDWRQLDQRLRWTKGVVMRYRFDPALKAPPYRQWELCG